MSNPEDDSAPRFLDPYTEIDRRRHRLPHWQQGDISYFVTWRLADSLPREKLDVWRSEQSAWLQHHPEPWDSKTEHEYHELFSQRIDHWLDAGSGSCLLRTPSLAKIVAVALQHFDDARYKLSAFLVMPNHVHVLFQLLPGYRLEAVLQSWKGFTAREINRRCARVGPLWQEDYWDRMIRNEAHFAKCVDYILSNPEKAGLREGEFICYEV
jgi:type I restriction enzyme R subunit